MRCAGKLIDEYARIPATLVRNMEHLALWNVVRDACHWACVNR